MTSRRSFLRGLLALPALPAAAQLPVDAPSYGGPIPDYGDGPIATVGCECDMQMHAPKRTYIKGSELLEEFRRQLREDTLDLAKALQRR